MAFLFFFPNFFTGMLQKLARPIWQIKSSKLEEDYAALKDPQVAALLSENLELKNILDRQETSSKTILAAILTWPPVSPFDSVIVDVGEDQGIKVGERAIALGNFAIGDVAEVHKNSAIVRLYSSPGEKLQVMVVGSSTVATAAEGRGGGNFYISLPIDTTIDLGDPVVLSGIKTILLGTVEKIYSKSNDSFKSVYFKLPVNIRDLRYLEIEQTS